MNFFFFFFFKGKHCKIIQYFNLQGSGFNRRKHYTSTCITKIMIVFSKYCFSNERVFQNDYELIYRTGVRYKTIIDIYIIKALVVFLSIYHLFQRYFLGCMQNSVLVQKKELVYNSLQFVILTFSFLLMIYGTV